jgi:hypothetical protein
MKFIYITVVLFLFVNQAFSQSDPVGNFNRHVFESWKGEYIRIGGYKVKGSPYLLGESFPGVATYKDGKVVSDQKILYDIYNQKAGLDVKNEIFERDVPLESFAIALPEKMGGQKLLFKNSYVFDHPDIHLYFNVVEEGKKVALLKVYKSKLVPDPVNAMDKESKVFQQFFDYYIYRRSDKTISNVKLRKKDIIKGFGDEQFINQYTSKIAAVDFANEAEIITMIKYYNNNN